MKGRKGSTDEDGIGSPSTIKWPGKLKPGKKISQIAAAIDLLPTLADLIGIEFQPAKRLYGVSLKSLLLRNNPEWNERYIFNHWEKQTSVRSQNYRLDYNGNLFNIRGKIIMYLLKIRKWGPLTN